MFITNSLYKNASPQKKDDIEFKFSSMCYAPILIKANNLIVSLKSVLHHFSPLSLKNNNNTIKSDLCLREKVPLGCDIFVNYSWPMTNIQH